MLWALEGLGILKAGGEGWHSPALFITKGKGRAGDFVNTGEGKE